jgi:hypothetical protein
MYINVEELLVAIENLKTFDRETTTSVPHSVYVYELTKKVEHQNLLLLLADKIDSYRLSQGLPPDTNINNIADRLQSILTPLTPNKPKKATELRKRINGQPSPYSNS